MGRRRSGFWDALLRCADQPWLHALGAMGMYFGPMPPWPAASAGPAPAPRREAGPPPLHPERLRTDLPLTALERRLARELAPVPRSLRWEAVEGER